MIDNLSNNFGATGVAILALALCLGPSAEAAQSLELAWNPSTAAGVAGYHIYYGNNGTNFQYKVDAGTNTSYQVGGLQEGQTNSFIVTAYDAQGVESEPSNLISYLVPGRVNFAAKAGPRSPAVLSFSVAPGHTYQVQASVNLTTWSTIWQTTPTNNAWTQFEDAEGANLRMRFYRLIWQ
jgi:hypothetical protein